MKRLLALALCFLPISAMAQEWQSDYATALEAAVTQKRPLLILFTGSDWCGPCQRLQKKVFEQAEFLDYAKEKLILLKIDFPRNPPLPLEEQRANQLLADQLSVIGYPTVLLMSRETRGPVAIHSRNSPKRFLAEIERRLSGR